RRTNRLRMNASAEPNAGLTGQIETLHRPTDTNEIEIGRFEENVRRAGRYLRLRSTHDASDSNWTHRVGYHQVVRRKLPQLPIERLHFFTRPPGPNDDGGLATRTLRQLVVIERVQRLSPFQHHVIGNVHDVVDGPHAGVSEPALHPARRRNDSRPLD